MKFKLGFAALAAVSALIASEALAPLGKYTPAERRHWAFREALCSPEIPHFTASGRSCLDKKLRSMRLFWRG